MGDSHSFRHSFRVVKCTKVIIKLIIKSEGFKKYFYQFDLTLKIQEICIHDSVCLDLQSKESCNETNTLTAKEYLAVICRLDAFVISNSLII